jgi:hypothetical protein
MTMTPRLRKFVLAAHLTFSVGWIGTVVAYLALGIAAVTSHDDQTVRSAWIAMELTGWYVIVPLALASLLTGLVMALGTKWGLFRHYWVLFSFVMTAFATTILLLHMPSVSLMADVAKEAEGPMLDGLGGDLLHPGLGLLVLLVIHVLNVYKPRGVTRYGWRKEYERRKAQPIPPRDVTKRSEGDARTADVLSLPDASNDSGVRSERGSVTGTRWRLYIWLGIVGLVLLFIILHLVDGGIPSH